MYFFRHTPPITAQLRRVSAVVSDAYYLILLFTKLEFCHPPVKKYLRRNYWQFQNSLFPERDLADACFAAITAEKAQGWFRDCGYL
jgi:hypothetical protein